MKTAIHNWLTRSGCRNELRAFGIKASDVWQMRRYHDLDPLGRDHHAVRFAAQLGVPTADVPDFIHAARALHQKDSWHASFEDAVHAIAYVQRNVIGADRIDYLRAGFIASRITKLGEGSHA